METIFHFDRENHLRCQEQYRGARRADYHEGEYVIDAAGVVDVRADKKDFGAAAVIRLTSQSRLKFRRSQAHIRRDNVDLTVLWFVRHGSISFATTSAQPRLARAGELLLTQSASPFFMECLLDLDGRHEVVHVTVPTYLVRPFLPDGIAAGLVLSAASGRVAMARHMLEELFAAEELISRDSGWRLVEAAFSLIGEAMVQCAATLPKPLSIAQRRIEEVLRFITLHLCDPNLSTAMVCRGCGISPRYLTTLLRTYGSSFTALVWGQRMAKAQAWLSASKASEVPVSEVAHSLGFKSAAHFSRRFKQTFAYNPSERRDN